MVLVTKSFDQCLEIVDNFISKKKGTKEEAARALSEMEDRAETPYQCEVVRLTREAFERR